MIGKQSRSALEATTETLRASLADSAQAQLDEVVEGYEFQIASLETSLEVQQGDFRAAERLRAQTQNDDDCQSQECSYRVRG